MSTAPKTTRLAAMATPPIVSPEAWEAAPMYLLMSLFHSPPWLKLIASRCDLAPWPFV